jgi:hypothetical protein
MATFWDESEWRAFMTHQNHGRTHPERIACRHLQLGRLRTSGDTVRQWLSWVRFRPRVWDTLFGDIAVQ